MPSKNLAELKERIDELERELREPKSAPSTTANPTATALSATTTANVVPNGVALDGGDGAAVFRPKIAEMSSEVRDDNPYSRLMALKRMGIVDDYERIRMYRLVCLSMT